MKAPEQHGPRMEIKFRMQPPEAEALLDWVSRHFQADPHARDAANPLQSVVSLYFDDQRRTSYPGRVSSKLPKHRLRQYDGESDLFMEEKVRLGDRVWKRRVKVLESSLPGIVHGFEPLHGEDEWFRSRFRSMGLIPTLLIRYERRAFESACGARVTFDSAIAAARVAEAYSGLSTTARQHPAINAMVVEVKGPVDQSNGMHEVLSMLGTPSRNCSKYCRGLEAVGLEGALGDTEQ